MKKLPIIMLALPRHDGPYSSTAFSLATELSFYTQVFYIENPYTWKDYIQGFFTDKTIRIRRKLGLFQDVEFPSATNLKIITPPLVLPINWMSNGKLYNFLSRKNDQIVFRTLRKIISRNQLREFIYINSFNPLIGLNFPAAFTPTISIYHCVDDIAHSDYISRHGTYLEDAYVFKSDITIVTSSELSRLKSKLSSQVKLLPNAANVALFQKTWKNQYERPEEIPTDRKVIGYIGNICHRVDYELLLKIAKAYKDTILLLIGPKSSGYPQNCELDSMGNVVFTGSKSINDLPQYLAYVDCCIIPFVKNTLTKSIYPLKINEYLSAGKPVVTTTFSQDVGAFKEVVYLAENHDDFVRMLREAILEDSETKRAERIALSEQNDWKFRAKDFWKIVENYVRKK